MSQPAPAPRPLRSPAKLQAALTRYRVMAFITGGFLLLLCLEILLKYAFNDGQPVIGTWVAIIHGYIYMAYLVTVFDLWSSLRWRFGRLLALIAAGVVPFLSFWAERKTTVDVRRLIAEREATLAGAPAEHR